MKEKRDQSLNSDNRIRKTTSAVIETKYMIVDSIWIGEDQLLFLTHDRVKEIVYLEIFSRAENN